VRLVERVTVQVEGEIGFDPAGAEAPVPVRIETAAGLGFGCPTRAGGAAGGAARGATALELGRAG